jgi:TP901 family phage tail tape measure protein
LANTRVNIDVNINTSAAAKNLRQLQAQINSFQSSLNTNNRLQGDAAKFYSQQLKDLANQSGFFSAETVKMRTAASQLDQTLSKGQGTMRQFFSARFLKSSSQAAQVLSLANARVSALETQFVATGAAAGGFREAVAVRPLQAFNSAASVSVQKLAIHRAMLSQATTSMINFGKNTQWAGRQLMVGFTVPLTIFAGVAGKAFREIEIEAVNFKKVYGDAFTPPEEMDANLKAVQGLAKEYTKYGIAVKDTIGLAAQAAATGAQNADLIDATRESTRLATLGQMDQNKALETTIALQTAFKISGEDLGKTINFLNMVENQTVVTLQDLAEAIPRVAPVIKGLGGSVEDMAVMLAAMREGGVTAAQGANALKSGLASLINPTDRAIESLDKMGINLNSIISINRGDLLGTIQAFGQALSTLDEFSRQQALEKVFGKFQYARLGALFNNIVKDGSQASRVMDTAAMSAEQLAASAEKELGAIEESAATKFVAAMEKLKLAIAPIGEMFTKMAIPVLGFLGSLVEKFNSLPDFAKKFIGFGTVITGIIIPAGTMFLGLLMNLAGTLTKFGLVVGVAFKGFTKGGFRGAIEAVSQALNFMSLAEIDAATASSQLGTSTGIVNQALRDQVPAAAGADAAIDNLTRSYTALVAQMAEAAALSQVAFVAPGAAMSAAAATGVESGRRTRRPRVRRNAGGTIPGSGNTDTVPAMLTPGEFVVNKQATAENLPLLYAINKGKGLPGFNKGGQIPGMQYFAKANPIRMVQQISEAWNNDAVKFAGKFATGKMKAPSPQFLDQAKKSQAETFAGTKSRKVTSPIMDLVSRVARPSKTRAISAVEGLGGNVSYSARGNIGYHTRYNQQLREGSRGAAITRRQLIEDLNDPSYDSFSVLRMQAAEWNARNPNNLVDPDSIIKHFLRQLAAPKKIDSQIKDENSKLLFRKAFALADRESGRNSAKMLREELAKPYIVDSKISRTELKGIVTNNANLTDVGRSGVDNADSLVIKARRIKGSDEINIEYSAAKGSGLPDSSVPPPKKLSVGKGQYVMDNSNPPNIYLRDRDSNLVNLRDAIGEIGYLAKDQIPYGYKTVTNMPKDTQFAHANKGGMIPMMGKGGPLFLGKPHAFSAVQKARSAQAEKLKLREEILTRSDKKLRSGKFANMEEVELGKRIERIGGRSSELGLNGIYNVDGKMVVAKIHDDPSSALLEARMSHMSGAFGLKSPAQRAVKIKDPSTGKMVAAVISPYEKAISNPAGKIRKEDLGNQTIAGLYRRETDAQMGNVDLDRVNDVGKARYGTKASTLRDIKDPESVSSFLDTFFLQKKGGAKKWFMESTADIARQMSPDEYEAMMRGAIQSAKNKAKTYTDTLPYASPSEKAKWLKDMSRDLEELEVTNWKQLHNAHTQIKPGKVARKKTKDETGHNESLSRFFARMGGIIPQMRNLGGQIFDSTKTSRKIVPGVGNKDTVPAVLTPGEFVINKEATRKNLDLLHSVNNGTIQEYNLGGLVQEGTDSSGKKIYRDPSGKLVYGNRRSVPPNRIPKPAPTQRRGIMGGGRAMGLSMGIGMAGGAMMMSPMVPGIGQNEGLSSVLSQGGFALSLASMLPMLGKFGVAIGVIAAPLVAATMAFKSMRESIDKVAEQATIAGQNIGGAAGRMEELSAATGYQFSLSRSQGRMFRFTEQETQDASQFSEYFEGEKGQKFIKDIKDLSSEKRYKKVASIIAQGVADGMDPKTAQAYGNAIAAYSDDAILKARLATDFKKGKFSKGTEALVDLLQEREDAVSKEVSSAGRVKPIDLGPGGAVGSAMGQQGANAAFGNVVLGGGIGGLAGGAIAGAIIGSFAPGIGTAIGFAVGALVGGIGAWMGSAEMRGQIEKNTKILSTSFGGSLEVLKEVANAEAAISEARRNNTITEEESIEQLSKVREIEESATNRLKDSLSSMISDNIADPTAMQKGLKNALILNSGFDEGQAQAVVETMNFDSVAAQLFPTKSIEEIKADPAYTEAVVGVIAETLSGITPENAGSKIADIQGQFARIGKDLVQAAVDGLTSTEVRGLVTKASATEIAKNAMETAAGRDLTEAETLSDPKLMQEAIDRALSSGAKARQVPGVRGSIRREEFFVDPETGMEVKSKKRKRSIEDQATDLGMSLSNTATGGTAEGFVKFAEETGQEVVDVLAQVFNENPEKLTLWMNSIKDPENAKEIFAALFPDLSIEAAASKMQGIFDFARSPEYEYTLVGPIDKAAESFGNFADQNSTALTTMGVSVEEVSTAFAGLTDIDLMTNISESETEFMRFAGMVKELSEFPGIDIELMMKTEDGRDPKDVAKDIKTTLKQIGDIDFKKSFGENWKEMASASTMIDPKQFINMARGMQKAMGKGFDPKQITEWYKTALTSVDNLRDNFAKSFDEDTGLIKKVTVPIITSVFGQNVEDAAGIMTALNNALPDGFNPMILPIIAQLRMDPRLAEVLKNPEALGSLAKYIQSGGTESQTFTQTETVSSPYGGYEKATTINWADYAAPTLSGTSPFGGGTTTDKEDGSGGGDKETTVLEDLKKQLKMIKQLFKGLNKFFNSNSKTFKNFIAGPFAPEFLEYIQSQGEKGLKLIKQGAKAVLKAYKVFEKVQVSQAAVAALTAPLNRAFEISRELGSSNFQNALSGQGISNERIDYVTEAVGSEGLASYQMLRSKGKKGRTKSEQAEFEALRKDIGAAIEQSKAMSAISQLGEIRSSLNETGTSLRTFYELTSKGIDPIMAQAMMDMGISIETASQMSIEQLKNLESTIRQNQISEAAQSISTSLKEMSNEIKMDAQLAGQGFYGEIAQELKDVGVTLEMLQDKPEVVKAISAQLTLLKKAAEDAKDPLTKLSEVLDMRITSLQAQMEAYERSSIKPLEDALDLINQNIAKKQRDIELEERKKEAYEDNIDTLEDEQEALQETFDERVKALEKIEKVNERIAKQQQSQLDVASALSRGDIAGAAQAALKSQQEQAQNRVQEARETITTQYESEREAIEEKIKQNKLEMEAIDDRIKTIQLDMRKIQDDAYNKQIEIDNARKEQLKTEEKIYKTQLLQNILQARNAVQEAARTGNVEKVAAAQASLNSMIGVAGGTEEDRAKFFTGISGAGQILSESASASKKPAEQLVAESFMSIQDMVNGIFNESAKIVSLLVSSGKFTEEQALKFVEDLKKPENGPATIIKSLNDAGISLFDLLGIGGAADGNVPELAGVIGNSMLASSNYIAGMPTLAEGMYNAFKGMKKILEGKIDEGRNIASAINAAISAWNNRPKDEPKKDEKKPTKKAFGGIMYKGSTEPAPGMMYGGSMKKYATGSWVPGSGMTDKVPALLTPGEFVVRKSVASEYGPLLSAINSNVFPRMNMSGAMPKNSSNNKDGIQYNYEVNVNVAGSNASPDEIANTVMYKIKRMDDRQIRGTSIG